MDSTPTLRSVTLPDGRMILFQMSKLEGSAEFQVWLAEVPEMGGMGRGSQAVRIGGDVAELGQWVKALSLDAILALVDEHFS